MIRQRMEAAHDRVAAQYAEQNAIMPPLLVEFATRFLTRLEPGANILDVGCGDGRHMAWMEAQGLHATGIDISTGMLAQARPHVQGELLQMDMCHLTFPPASFAGIWLVQRLSAPHPESAGTRGAETDASCSRPRRHSPPRSTGRRR